MFKYIKSKRNDVAGVFPLKDKQGKTQTGDDKIAKIINEHYCSVFSKDNGITPNILGPKGSDIANIHFTRNGVTGKKALSPQFTKEEINPDRLQKVIDQ